MVDNNLATRIVGNYRIIEEPKTKQRVVRTRVRERPRYMESLVTSLNAGWKVVMCNPIGNELEYILEKECGE